MFSKPYYRDVDLLYTFFLNILINDDGEIVDVELFYIENRARFIYILYLNTSLFMDDITEHQLAVSNLQKVTVC